MEGCVFCNIASGALPSTKLYEDAGTLAFLDIHPNNPGHALVIPKEHFQDIYSTPDGTIAAMMQTAKRVAHALKKGLDAHGVNIAMNNEGPAGQIIFHAHIHVIPRKRDDGFKHWGTKTYQDGEAEAVAEKIRAAL